MTFSDTSQCQLKISFNHENHLPSDNVTAGRSFLHSLYHYKFFSLIKFVKNGFSWNVFANVFLSIFLLSNKFMFPYLEKSVLHTSHQVRFQSYSHANRKSIDKWSLTCLKNILKISYSNYLYCSNLPVKCSIFLKSSLFFNSFYCLFCW